MAINQEQPDDPSSPHRFADLVTVFRGGNAEALVVHSALESRGFHPFLESKTLGRPFVTGGNVFEAELKAPAAEALAALDCIQELRESALEAPADEVPWEREETADIDAERVGRKLRWASALFLGVGLSLDYFLPLAGVIAFLAYFLFGLHYLKLSRRSSPLPQGHRITVACFSLASILYGATLAAAIYFQFRRARH